MYFHLLLFSCSFFGLLQILVGTENFFHLLDLILRFMLHILLIIQLFLYLLKVGKKVGFTVGSNETPRMEYLIHCMYYQ